MSKNKSRRKAKQRSAPAAADSAADSLDFSHIGPSKVPAPGAGAKPVGRKASRSGSAPGVSPVKTTGTPDQDKAGRSRRLAVPLLIIIATVLVVAFATTERSSKELATPDLSATPTSPTSRSPPTYKAPQASAPPSSPQSVQPPALPAEFLKAFQEYAAKSGNKAMALALDSDGRSAYVGVSGSATQSEANEEALSECTRFKAQSGVQENCRLYAVGDKVVW